jgi:hypothetical protein
MRNAELNCIFTAEDVEDAEGLSGLRTENKVKVERNGIIDRPGYVSRSDIFRDIHP